MVWTALRLVAAHIKLIELDSSRMIPADQPRLMMTFASGDASGRQSHRLAICLEKGRAA